MKRILEPGANISTLARTPDIAPSQLFGWRRAAAVRAENIGADADVRRQAPRVEMQQAPSTPVRSACPATSPTPGSTAFRRQPARRFAEGGRSTCAAGTGANQLQARPAA